MAVPNAKVDPDQVMDSRIRQSPHFACESQSGVSP
jgi:hypothetical protein